MRVKMIFLSCLLTSCLLLCGCQQVINSPADEFVLYDWQAEQENGKTVSLDFDDDSCSLMIRGNDVTTDIVGKCFVTDDQLVICDENNGQNYSFGYRLYGDHVELSYNGSVLTLQKTGD